MGAKYVIRSVFLQGDFISYTYADGADSILGAVVEEVAVRLAERVCPIFRCSCAVVVVLVPACAEGQLS